LKKAEKEVERKDITKTEEDDSYTCEEQSQQEDFMAEERCLVKDEEIKREDAKGKVKCLNGEEESLKNDEKRVGEEETKEVDVKKEEEYLIREEDMDKEEFHKAEESAFALYLSDDFAEEEKPAKEMKAMGKVPNKQELEKQIVFKVDKEVISRVKEKPD